MRYKCRKKTSPGKNPTKQEERRKYTEEDVEEWLKVSLPILKGPFASKPWIKYVLKELTRANGLAVGI
ncbi:MULTISPECIES: hypothetical protein [Thermoanaerobacter]|uniref:Uncharacterized protein n=1 Tax=Thermoanaerobacter pentosaceus TaxID=694059 RepID=A0ABT9M4A6_9THEO|nr:hypothetical protein [Thermoanaerobacter pentosaceus]